MNKGNDLIKPQYISNKIYHFHLICLDENYNQDNNDQFHGFIQDLQPLVYSSPIFSDFDQCFDYIRDLPDDEQKAIVLYSGALIEKLILFVQDMPQIDSIYILQENRLDHAERRCLPPKIKYEHNDLKSIYKSIGHTIRKYYQDYLTLPCLQTSTKTVGSHHNELEPSFMYTLICKEIFLDPDFQPKHFNDFISYCQQKYCDSNSMLEKVAQFEEEYAGNAIYWYTRPTFIFEILNHSLRTMNIDLIIKLDFFIRDLNQQIVSLHAEQYGNSTWNSFDVYRGQVLLREISDKLRGTQDGLLSFNNFISISLAEEVALVFADPSQPDSDQVGVLFRIALDPTIQSNVFANTKGSTYQPDADEEEIMFSMNSIFRLGKIERCDKQNDIWIANLTLTKDTDADLLELAAAVRADTQGATAWERLGHLMIKMHRPNEAELIYRNLLQNATQNTDTVHIYHQLAQVQTQKGNLNDAEQTNIRAQEIYGDYYLLVQAVLPALESDLRDMRSGMDKHSEMLPQLENAYESIQKFLSDGPQWLATSINNMGALYDRQGESKKAIGCYETTLKMRERYLPPDDLLLAASFCSTGTAYTDIGNYSKASEYQEKALEIQQQSRPANHPETSLSYNNRGSLHFKMKNYPQALQCYKTALEMQQKSLPKDHPHVATSYNNIGGVYSAMDDYLRAESYHLRALEMRRVCLSENHPETATSYANLGSTYAKMNEHSKAISFYEKAVAIQREFLPQCLSDLGVSYQNMCETYYAMGDYHNTIAYGQDALVMREQSRPTHFASLVSIHKCIGSAYLQIAEYSEAITSYEKALELELEQEFLPEDHHGLAVCIDNLGFVYLVMEEYSSAISYFETALAIRQQSFPKDDRDFASSLNNLALVYRRMGEYQKALSYYNEALEILQVFPSENDCGLATTYNNMGLVYCKWGQHAKAIC